jgi:hypothetical protein
MATRKTLIVVGCASAAIAAAAVVALVSSGSDSTTKTTSKKAGTVAKTKTESGEILPLEHKWVISIEADSNLVVGDPDSAAEGAVSKFSFQVVDSAGTTGAKGNERIVRGKIVDATGPLAEPVYVIYVSRDNGKTWVASRGKAGDKGKVMDFADLMASMPIQIPFDDAIRSLPKTATQKAAPVDPQAPPPGLPPVSSQTPTGPDLPNGGATPPPVSTP